ncbi:hypothetical protein [Halorussus pelagicus]|uniref:hypothetical protein n=1 Tax=Halorussus pelagicus TaxID=2505977 RepID=UPI000FFC723A|nr:hypothetical protein [Halorussus pelagicus]
MITEQSLFEMLEDYEDHLSAAEASYLATKGFKPEEINQNLQLRYGVGRGYADFKRDFEELTDHEVDDGYRVRLVVNGDKTDFEDVTVEDVAVPLDQVLQNAFRATVEEQLRAKVRENIQNLSDDARLLAGISRKGYDLSLWDDSPRSSDLWQAVTLTTDCVLSDRKKEETAKELVQAGCLYDRDGSLYLTPMLLALENPFEHLSEPIRSGAISA